MEALSPADIALLRAFGVRHNVTWWLQSKGPETVQSLDAAQIDALAYTLPEFGLRMPYRPTDFTQVNHAVNRTLISRALTLLDVQRSEEHTSELQSLMRISYAVFCLKKKKQKQH